jgi:uncharacterized protein (TIGR02300 family)
VAKPELGTKRVCPTTGRKFYDLNKDPVISPYTGQVVPIEAPAPTRGGRAEAARAAVVPEEVEVAEAPEAEFVSLEEADAEAEGGGAKVTATGDEDVEVDESLDDAAFIVPEEEEEDDVTDIIGGDIEDEEES